MNIVSPISRIDEVEPVIEAGADEVYCGVFTFEESKEYTNLCCLNRRATAVASLNSFGELKRIVNIAHSHNVLVSFTINERYSERQFPSALSQIDKAIESGIDALIVADIGLLYMLKRRKLEDVKIHISSTNMVLNSESIDFYRELGASRIILPRQLTMEEIGVIARKCPNIELEILVLNKKCRYAEGFCALQHGLTEAKYSFLVRLQNLDIVKKFSDFLPKYIINIYRNHFFKHEFYCYSIYNTCISASLSNHKKGDVVEDISSYFSSKIDIESILNVNGCAVCSLYGLDKLGINFVKIIGRGNSVKKKVLDVRFISDSIGLIKEKLTEREFRQKVRDLYRRIHLSDCNPEYCYYPDELDES